jgi:hydrogenase maturation protein HypF
MGEETLKDIQTYKINISGVVQGVGFRPFVLSLAESYGICGSVRNTGGGVEIYAAGEELSLSSFIKDLNKKRPPRAHIAEIVVQEAGFSRYEDFQILPSTGKAGAVFVPTDTAICPDCARELFDSADRRYLYPFINCTQCGARYTIINDLPYDRPSTSMAGFPMCPECAKEYSDPVDRRFHAQPNACPVCGPEVFYGSLKGIAAIKEIARLIDSGEIAAVKGLGGYHIVCDALNPAAICRLRLLKKRPTKPFAVMCRELPADIPQAAAEAIMSPNAPIVIIPCGINFDGVNPLSGDIGFMQAYTPLHKVLLSFTKTPFIIATSGNVSGEPIIADNDIAERELAALTPHFLHHNRPIVNPADDSVAVYSLGEIRLLRRGRGYAPFPITFPSPIPPLFAAGAHLKSTLTLTAGRFAFVSPFIGDTETAAAQEFYESTFHRMSRLLGTPPALAVCDMHPDYFSTRFARSLGLPIITVQHHHAHLFSVMAEHSLMGGTVGIIMDGTGYGTDGTIWGGEILVYSDREVRRAAHIEQITIPRGDAAQRFPSIAAASWLISAGIWGDPFWTERLGERAALAADAVKAGINTIFSTSAGRLCEGVGSLALGIRENEYEAHSALALEAAAGETAARYPYNIDGGRILFAPAIAALCKDIKEKALPSEISARWHNTFAAAVSEAGIRAAKEAGIKDIALSGGVFQNRLLLEKVYRLVTKSGLNCRVHRDVPSNDGGISLGQAYYIYLSERAY